MLALLLSPASCECAPWEATLEVHVTKPFLSPRWETKTEFSPSPAPAVVGFWGMNQQVGALSLSLPLKDITKKEECCGLSPNVKEPESPTPLKHMGLAKDQEWVGCETGQQRQWFHWGSTARLPALCLLVLAELLSGDAG